MSMILVITVRKEVPDQATGQQVWANIQQKLDEYEGLTVSGHLSNHLEGYVTDGNPDG